MFSVNYFREAERLLSDKPIGCFLIRISETKFGYSLSYRFVFDEIMNYLQ